MSDTVESITNAFQRAYNTFILRDLVGIALPGAVSLFAIWGIVAEKTSMPGCESAVTYFDCLKLLASLPVQPHAIALSIGLSYLTGWTLQAIHHSLIDASADIFKAVRPWVVRQTSFLRRPLLSILARIIFWPLQRMTYYASKLRDPKLRPHTHSFATAAALSPDMKSTQLAWSANHDLIKDSSPYTERLSVLILMTGNVAIAGILLLWFFLAKSQLPYWADVAFLLAIILTYLEHWRLWYARNLRHQIYVEGSQFPMP